MAQAPRQQNIVGVAEWRLDEVIARYGCRQKGERYIGERSC